MLIPIITMICEADGAGTLLVPALGATLAGSVYGDHCSPISDTTIMASTGAQCDHVNHVSTQLPYAFTVAGVCAVGYLLAGFVQNVFVVLGVSIVMMIGVLFLIRFFSVTKKPESVKPDAENTAS